MAENVKRSSSRGSDDGLGKRPSIVMIQDTPKQTDGEGRTRPASSSGSSGVLNPAVKNRTGKPSTEKGKLVDLNYNTNAEMNKKPTSPSVSPVDRSRRPSANRRSSANLSSKTSGYRSLNEGGVRDQIKKKMSMENASSKNTPSTVARQREIQRKMRKEKAEVEAKYEDSAHNSALRNDHDGELLPLGQGRAAGGRSRSSVNEKKSERFTLVSSNRRSKSTLPREPSSSSNNRGLRSNNGSQVAIDGKSGSSRASSGRSRGDAHLLINGEGSGRLSRQSLDDGAYTVRRPRDSDNSLFDKLSELSLSTADYLDFEEHDSNRSRYFPKIVHNNELSPMNFTKNFNFSYFQCPGHVKEHNSRVSQGWFKLPKLPLLGVKSKRERRKSNLLRRIEKLNQAQPRDLDPL